MGRRAGGSRRSSGLRPVVECAARASAKANREFPPRLEEAEMKENGSGDRFAPVITLFAERISYNADSRQQWKEKTSGLSHIAKS